MSPEGFSGIKENDNFQIFHRCREKKFLESEVVFEISQAMMFLWHAFQHINNNSNYPLIGAGFTF